MLAKRAGWFAAGLVLLTVLSRLLPHAHNFTPVIGVALFAGAKLPNRWLGIAVCLSSMLISDLFLGLHSTMWAVYGSLALIVWAGDVGLRSESNYLRRLGWTSTSGALFFFGVTNFAVWLGDGMYPMTLEGLLECFVAAIPFFPATLVSTWVYSFALFGLWSLIEFRALRSELPPARLS